MKLSEVPDVCLQNAKAEFGENDTTYKIIAQSLPVGMEHMQLVCAGYDHDEKMTRRQMNRNRKEAKERAYKYLKANTPATSQSVGMGPIAGMVFWFLMRQALWWLASRLINWFLFDDKDED